jgi:PST family polysaccharide transporter
VSLGKKAVIGAIWSTGASIGARLISVVSTLVLTRFLSPEVQGEVNIAFVITSTVGLVSSLGMGQYIVAHPRSDRQTSFHASVLSLAGGAAMFAICWAVCAFVGRAYGSEWVEYVPSFLIALCIERVAMLPRNILAREMRFGVIGVRTALGELTFATASVALAFWGWGGHSITAANIARSALGALIFCAVTDVRDYFAPCKLHFAKFRELMRYGGPTAVGTLFHYASMTFDNLFMGWRFNEATVGLYNQAYKLADLPTMHLGEQLNDVLVPSFARITDPEARKAALARVAGLFGVLIFPCAIGLGAVGYTLVEAAYPPEWVGVAPFLIVLSVLSIFRPIGVLVLGFLQVIGRAKAYMVLDMLKLVTILGSMALLAPLGPVWACAGVGLGFALNAVQMVYVVRSDGIAPSSLLLPLLPPLLACIPMSGAVLGVRYVLPPTALPAVARLLIEIAVGAVVYVPSALFIARESSREFLRLLRSGIARRRGTATPVEAESPSEV